MKLKYPEEIEYTSGGSGFNTMKTASVSDSSHSALRVQII